jgi:hypothetical protein
MAGGTKTRQLQIRLSVAQKATLQRAAARAGLDVSAYVLARVAAPAAGEFTRLVRAAGQGDGRFPLAELNALLTSLTGGELEDAIAGGIPGNLAPRIANTIAAMVETACASRELEYPRWTQSIPPLTVPVFGSGLLGLRLYLLTHSPAPFRRRNIFVDATLGDQV